MSDEIVHYGVKGMHWGVHKAPNSSYTDDQRRRDKRVHGSRAVKRINKRMNKGQSLKTARGKEVKRNVRQILSTPAVAYGATFVALTAAHFTQMAMGEVAIKAETNRGRAAAADIMGLPQTATNGPTYNKANRKGVYNISSI
jgi:hypothetical protein